MAFGYTLYDSQSTRESEMRQAYMSSHNGMTASVVKDMTLRENPQPWDFGACRRR
jgi:hypothetical protein